MSLRFRRSVTLFRGVRLNLTKTGIGISGGVRGARVSVHSSGRRTASVGIPGTGLSYRVDRVTTHHHGAPAPHTRASRGVSLRPPGVRLPTPPAPPAWYPDPTTRHQYRYWDGSTWTEHVADHGERSDDATG
jgi:hypothetical protein